MTNEKGITTLRLFIGWKLPEEMRREIGGVVAELRHALPRASWTRPESYHVTFAFLGDHAETVVPRLGRELDAAMGGLVAASVQAVRPGFFPSLKRPRVGWVALEPEDQLGDVWRRVRSAVARAGLAMDDRPFTAHLTLVRIREGWPVSAADSFRSRFESFASVKTPFDSVSLFSSRLESAGAVHTELHRVEFRAE